MEKLPKQEHVGHKVRVTLEIVGHRRRIWNFWAVRKPLRWYLWMLYGLFGTAALLTGFFGLLTPSFTMFATPFFVSIHFGRDKMAERLVFTASEDRVRITRPPFGVILGIVTFLYSRKTFERVFRECIMDAQAEYFDALAGRRWWHARWIYVRGLGSVAATIVLHAGTSAVAKCVMLFRVVG